MSTYRLVGIDANHVRIVRALRQVGAKVIELGRYGVNPDLLVWFRGKLFLLEVKTDEGRLQRSQRQLIEEGWPIVLIRSENEALSAIGAI